MPAIGPNMKKAKAMVQASTDEPNLWVFLALGNGDKVAGMAYGRSLCRKRDLSLSINELGKARTQSNV